MNDNGKRQWLESYVDAMHLVPRPHRLTIEFMGRLKYSNWMTAINPILRPYANALAFSHSDHIWNVLTLIIMTRMCITRDHKLWDL